MGQTDGVKKLRELRKEIAQIKTIARERELGVRGAKHELVSTLPVPEEKKAEKKGAKPAAAKKATAKAKTSAKKGAGK
jgi:large subunit ribosomal protein L29